MGKNKPFVTAILRTGAILALVFIFCAASIYTAAAQQGGTPDPRASAFEQEILDRLAQISPEAVPLFKQATTALDSGQFEFAMAGYQAVLKLAPDFPDALRRMSAAAIELQDTDSALQYAQAALDAQFSPLNQATLARALLSKGGDENELMALELVQQAYSASPDDPFIVQVMLMAGVMRNEGGVIRQASAGMLRLAPQHPSGHYFTALIAIEEGEWELADRELAKSKELGIDASTIDQIMSDYAIQSKALVSRWTRIGSYSLAGWAGLSLILLAASLLLRRITRSSSKQAKSDPEEQPSPRRLGAQRFQSVFNRLVSFYFYITVPILFIVSAAGGFLLTYIMQQVKDPKALNMGVVTGILALSSLGAILFYIMKSNPRRSQPR